MARAGGPFDGLGIGPRGRPMDEILRTLQSGFGNLAAYLAAHVLLCLFPAFFIAGAMSALIPKPAITRWLGRNTLLGLATLAAIYRSETCKLFA